MDVLEDPRIEAMSARFASHGLASRFYKNDAGTVISVSLFALNHGPKHRAIRAEMSPERLFGPLAQEELLLAALRMLEEEREVGGQRV